MEESELSNTNKEIISKARILLGVDNSEVLKLLYSFKILSREDSDDIYSVVAAIKSDHIDIVDKKSYHLCKIIESENTPEELSELCFQQIISILRSEDHELANKVFENICYSLKGFEKQRYGLLHIYLNTTKKISVLGNFFYNFKDPIYLFDVMARRHDAIGFRLSIDNLSNTISHFWSTNKVATENQILELFSYDRFGMLATKIIISSHYGVYPVDLLKLDTKEKQMLAIQSICNYPHSIDKLLPLVLHLRNSKFKGVKIFLQNTLAELIFDAYHETLLNLVRENLTSSPADKRFLLPLKKANDDYEKMKEFKSSIMDLSPRENERHLMDLYYGLEHETQATLMKDSNNDNSFLSAIKSMTIVRGNAWKIEDHAVPSPMQLIQSSILIDSRAYKNPIDYEYNLENL